MSKDKEIISTNHSSEIKNEEQSSPCASASSKERGGVRLHLLGMTMAEIQAIVEELGFPRFTAKQIADWVYKKNAVSIDDMTNISLANRTLLSEKCDVGRYAPVEFQESKDGTVKYLFRTEEGKLIETVMIPDEERKTLCVSSQVGCKFNCSFCMTGKQGFNGNLTANDIVNQLYSVREAEGLTNVVFMGMGEPLDNYDEVLKALTIMTSEYGMAWSPKRITVSTTGVTPNLKRFIEESSANLAVSLHSPDHAQRQTIMPAEKAYPIAGVIDLLKQYDWSHQRRVSFEYIMFAGFNDLPAQSKALVQLLKGIECRVNLIRFHAIPGVELKTSSQQKMEDFRDYLTSKGIPSTIRTSRGEDISAACGMLAGEKKKK